MKKGGASKDLTQTKAANYIGLLAALFMILYGFLIMTGVIYTAGPIDSFGFYMMSFWWICLGVLQWMLPNPTRLDAVVRFSAYHLLAGSYLIFITGISSPILAFWLVLAVLSYAYFSEIGFMLNILALVVIFAFDIIFWNRMDQAITVQNLISLATITVSSFIAVSVYRSLVVNTRNLSVSREKESLQHDRVLTIVNNLSDAVLSTDVDGFIRIYNASSLNLLDTNKSLNGCHIDEILPLFDLDHNKVSLFKELKSANAVVKRDDLNYTFSDIDKIRLEITYSPIRSSYTRSKDFDNHDGYIIIMRDITKAKGLEAERDEFISVISHELRTPITIVEGTISNVQVMMKHPDITNAMLADTMKTAHDQIVFLANMVNDLSALSRAERGVSDSTEDISVHELAHEMHEKYKDEAKAKKIHLDLDVTPTTGRVRANKLYLEELLQNLITNAIKYTKKGSVTIIVTEKDDVATFAIKDSGIGIGKTDQVKIFEKFYRSEDYRTRETNGTGLGLYVASKLAEKIGSTIELKSRLNFGSTFSFSLPIVKP